ncbi:hypothetical protein HPB52_006684 [Rhipicephalus sanguineus]|uniref:Glucose dehydrogenase n=1 Tax=Rhipicephalus sanguineus TaxID=34632 RepID=A0A9D4SZP8_RHISA|nr:hypothetical protein HPB52_006684 [Rhipicephalus sanguineus]
MSGDIDALACALWGRGAAPQNPVGLLIALVNLIAHVPFTDLPVLRDYELGELRQQYDYVIVGGGSAGCVVANRLSANPDTTVLLLEAGGLETASRQIPLTAAYNLGGHDDWDYRTVPQRNSCLSFHEQISVVADLPVGRSVQDHAWLFAAAPVMTDWQVGVSLFTLQDIAQYDTNRSGKATFEVKPMVEVS